MNQVEAIIFDFGGTLDSDGVDWFVRLYDMLSLRGLGLEREEFYQYTRQAARQMDKLADTRRLTMHQTVERLCHHVIEIIKDNNGACTMNWQVAEVAAQFMAEAGRFLRRNRQVLEQLRSGYRLGIISNNWGNTAGWCEQFQMSEFFETIIDSTLVGATKPDRAIFEAARAALALPAGACVYVGDHFENDVMGAHQAGMRTVWLTSSDAKQCPDETIVMHRIRKLPDILDIDWC